MNWTIAFNGVEKLLADWGLVGVTRRLVSQGQDELSFKADGSPADGTILFAPFAQTLTLWRNRNVDSVGVFSGGTQWFSGIVTQVPRMGAPDAEAMMYKVAGPWWYLDNLVFQQPYQNVFLGYATPGDSSTPATFGTKHSTHLFLNQGLSGSALVKVTTGAQIIEALNWALKPFVDASAAPPFQIGSVTPAVDAPIDEVRDITCAEVIRKMLRWTPDAVTWFDYSTSPPTFNCKRRAELATVNLNVGQT